LSKAFVKETGAIEIELIGGDEEGDKKWVANDVVVVGVAENNVGLEGHFWNEGIAELSEARATVNDEYFSAIAADFIAGGISTIFNGVWARDRDGASAAPDFEIHGFTSVK
jgi:hypothetical protein